jgi:hypothetical protein
VRLFVRRIIGIAAVELLAAQARLDDVSIGRKDLVGQGLRPHDMSRYRIYFAHPFDRHAADIICLWQFAS